MLANRRSRLLLPFGELHAATSSEIRKHLKNWNTRCLRNLIIAAKTVSTTNIWWASYRIAPEVLKAAEYILWERKNKKRKKGKGKP